MPPTRSGLVILSDGGPITQTNNARVAIAEDGLPSLPLLAVKVGTVLQDWDNSNS